jgi:precorrin-6B methylase 2
MGRGVSLVCAVAVLVALVSPALPAQEKAKTPEQQAWEQVDSLNKQSLQDFVTSFPDGELAKQAKVAIELQDKLAAIKEGKVAQPFIISLEVLGEKWKQWQKSKPNKAVVGYSMKEVVENVSTLGLFFPEPLTGGKTARSTTATDLLACPTGDGSIIAFSTNGLKHELLPGIVFETPAKDPMYFGVIQGKGLAHLKGTGRVTLPDGKAVDLEKHPDVIFVPTPEEVVDKMLELAQVSKDDLVYDLGCGDGRIVCTAAKKFGCKAVGFDVDPQRIKESNERVQKEGVGNLVTIEQRDIFTLDLSNVNVVTLYLLPSLNVRLIPQLEKLKPGSRIVSHDFDMAGVTPDQVVTVTSSNGSEHTVYLWTTPLKKEQTNSTQ